MSSEQALESWPKVVNNRRQLIEIGTTQSSKIPSIGKLGPPEVTWTRPRLGPLAGYRLTYLYKRTWAGETFLGVANM
jgi:hypothetical protein